MRKGLRASPPPAVRAALGSGAPLKSRLATPFLSVVVPAFNEEPRIGSTLDAVVAYLREQPYTWEVLVVDDGSSDRTAAVVSERASEDERVRLETLPHRGKGWAVRHGMLAVTGQLRFMCDADLAMPMEQLGGFLDRMAEGYDLVIGSRQIAGAQRIGEPRIRHLMGRVFNWGVRLLAVRGFEDTQCGYKCIRGQAADELFGLQRTAGFGFDVEVLYLATKRGMRVMEMPIEWHHRDSSKVRRVADSFAMLRDTLMLRLRDAAGRYPGQ